MFSFVLAQNSGYTDNIILVNRLNRKIKETGLAKEMSERILSQCVNVRGITSNEELDRIFDTDAERED